MNEHVLTVTCHQCHETHHIVLSEAHGMVTAVCSCRHFITIKSGAFPYKKLPVHS